MSAYVPTAEDLLLEANELESFKAELSNAAEHPGERTVSSTDALATPPLETASSSVVQSVEIPVADQGILEMTVPEASAEETSIDVHNSIGDASNSDNVPQLALEDSILERESLDAAPVLACSLPPAQDDHADDATITQPVSYPTFPTRSPENNAVHSDAETSEAETSAGTTAEVHLVATTAASAAVTHKRGNLQCLVANIALYMKHFSFSIVSTLAAQARSVWRIAFRYDS
jgi:hypothetical protein